jgi:hypothetical protein
VGDRIVSKVVWPTTCSDNSLDDVAANLRCTEAELTGMSRDIWPEGVYRNEGYRKVMETQRDRLRARLQVLTSRSR